MKILLTGCAGFIGARTASMLLERDRRRSRQKGHHRTSPADMQDASAEISKARDLLGWQPAVSPQEGFRRTATWHSENAAWLDRIEL